MITIGSDPEFFLVQGSSFKSGIGKIGGTKHDPAPLEREGFFIQEDNVAVEFNVPPASECREFVDNIEWAISHIGKKLQSHGYNIAWDASAYFPEEELAHPAAKVFGCEPDFNAWKEGAVNPRPETKEVSLRTCGGHIHIGYPENGERIFRHRLIQAADLFLGVPSCLVDRDSLRNKLYGKAGAFRPTPYGAEYRVLSNFWLRRKQWVEWAYRGMESAYKFVVDPNNWKILDKEADSIQECILRRLQIRSEELINEYNLKRVPV